MLTKVHNTIYNIDIMKTATEIQTKSYFGFWFYYLYVRL